MQLSPRQEKFAQHYAQNGNATEAYRQAGYSQRGKPENIHRRAIEVRDNRNVTARIEELSERIRERAEKEFGITTDWMLARYKAIADFDPRDFFAWNGETVTVRPSCDLSEHQAKMITSVKQTRGANASIEVKLADKMKALEALGKHIGFFELDQRQGASEVNIYLNADDSAL